MDFSRSERVSEEIKRIVSHIINNDLKDPRLEGLITVTKVDVPRDLRHAKIFVSVYGDDNLKDRVIDGLKKASGFIRRDLAAKIRLRYVPEISFRIDESVEYSLQINDLLKQIHQYGDDEGGEV